MLESFFSRIRAKGGFNDNPTVEQFKSAYRQVLVADQLTSSSRANCVDKLSIFHTSSAPPTRPLRDEDAMPHSDSYEHLSPNDCLLDAFQDATVCRIAAQIEHNIRTIGIFHCASCLNIFNENSKIVNADIISPNIHPCISTVHICKVSYKYLNIFKKHMKFDHGHIDGNNFGGNRYA